MLPNSSKQNNPPIPTLNSHLLGQLVFENEGMMYHCWDAWSKVDHQNPPQLYTKQTDGCGSIQATSMSKQICKKLGQ
jgi:hypothetical protein